MRRLVQGILVVAVVFGMSSGEAAGGEFCATACCSGWPDMLCQDSHGNYTTCGEYSGLMYC